MKHKLIYCCAIVALAVGPTLSACSSDSSAISAADLAADMEGNVEAISEEHEALVEKYKELRAACEESLGEESGEATEGEEPIELFDDESEEGTGEEVTTTPECEEFGAFVDELEARSNECRAELETLAIELHELLQDTPECEVVEEVPEERPEGPGDPEGEPFCSDPELDARFAELGEAIEKQGAICESLSSIGVDESGGDEERSAANPCEAALQECLLEVESEEEGREATNEDEGRGAECFEKYEQCMPATDESERGMGDQ